MGATVKLLSLLFIFILCSGNQLHAINRKIPFLSFARDCLEAVGWKRARHTAPPPTNHIEIEVPKIFERAPLPGRHEIMNYRQFAHSYVRFQMNSAEVPNLLLAMTECGGCFKDTHRWIYAHVGLYALTAINEYRTNDVLEQWREAKNTEQFRLVRSTPYLDVPFIGRQFLVREVVNWTWEIETVLELVLELHQVSGEEKSLSKLLTLISETPVLQRSFIALMTKQNFDRRLGSILEQVSQNSPDDAVSAEVISQLIDAYLNELVSRQYSQADNYLQAIAATQGASRYFLRREGSEGSHTRKYKNLENQYEDHYNQFFRR